MQGACRAQLRRLRILDQVVAQLFWALQRQRHTEVMDAGIHGRLRPGPCPGGQVDDADDGVQVDDLRRQNIRVLVVEDRQFVAHLGFLGWRLLHLHSGVLIDLLVLGIGARPTPDRDEYFGVVDRPLGRIVRGPHLLLRPERHLHEVVAEVGAGEERLLFLLGMRSLAAGGRSPSD